MLLVACVGFVVMTIPTFSIMPLGLGFAILGTLVAGFGSPLPPAFYLKGMALVSAVVVVLFFRETKDLSLTRTTVL